MRADTRWLGVRAVAPFVMCAAMAACDMRYGPTRPDTDWSVTTIGRFTFHVRPGSFAEQHTATFATVLEDQRQASVRALDHRYDGRLTLYLYSNGRDAGFGNDGSGGDHSGVAYAETETVKVAVVAPLDGNLLSLLNHEANHVYIRNGLGRPGTSFINEGLASALVSERLGAFGASVYHQWVRARLHQIPSITDLADDDRWGQHPSSTAYTVSASFLAYLSDTYGPTPLRQIYYASSRDFAEVFQQAYGRSLTDVEADWRAFLSGDS